MNSFVMDFLSLCLKDFEHLFAVVKMMLYSLDLLIVFMSFPGNEYHVTLLGKETRCADSLATVGITDAFVQERELNPFAHILEDVFGLFKTWIVTGE